MKRKLLALTMVGTLSLSTLAFAEITSENNDVYYNYQNDYTYEETTYEEIVPHNPQVGQRRIFTPQGEILLNETLIPTPKTDPAILALSRQELIDAIVEFNTPLFSITAEDMTHEELVELFHSLELEEADLNSPYFGAAAFADKENLVNVINEAITASFIETLEKSTDQQLRDSLSYLRTNSAVVPDAEPIETAPLERKTFTPEGNRPIVYNR